MTLAISDAPLAAPEPRDSPTAQIVPLAVWLLALIALIIAPIEVFKWYRTPFVGALFEPNHVVSLINGSHWAAKDAAVDWPDGLMAVNGTPLAPDAYHAGVLEGPRGQNRSLHVKRR